MKKIFFVLLIAAFIGSLFFAEKTSAKPAEIQTVRGKVDAVLIGSDVMDGNMSKIVIVDKMEQKINIVVKTGIGITIVASDKVVTLPYLKKGDMVSIDYITNKAGVKKAITIETLRRQKKVNP